MDLRDTLLRVYSFEIIVGRGSEDRLITSPETTEGPFLILHWGVQCQDIKQKMAEQVKDKLKKAGATWIRIIRIKREAELETMAYILAVEALEAAKCPF